ncbi:MAG: hypothetical protein A2418_00440 [Candidatus Brennerbacteria bacterium RIFOXYC1_FULL_41_11]|uniref:Peptidase M16 n=1 Tax=Candidatus Brennerbacteria bacterium RIFOXYD1_FULL_41_16 TaxID=1797529 RepID=A0A1G1XJZ8_9BACT|nr:MAG: hypothetical protein A2391_01900 [Candidatus Brennerbacteria bacterium RIFOXYB1_FULL_41_13]OGY39704.1 MAG: hypothetical protein A2418_00440 [Candidatus Brennerbacteria bacterium RIFOXYC1_FULL_41_11]OGY40328.1 MAG: hypothetical protein A2570_03565 [Candidatus Brennerbacteria bacterium RIFOXYD1_FULL_41_16]
MKNLSFEKLKTSSGVPLYVMNLPHANTVAAGVLVKAGTRDEIWPKEAGLAHALEHMVFQGTKIFQDSQRVGAYLEDFGGYHNAFTTKEGTFFYCRVPQEKQETIGIFLNEIINNQSIPEDKIKIEMQNIAEEIKMWNDDPGRFLQMATFKFLYQNHPLSRSGLGTSESVLSFEKKDFEKFLNRYYNNANFAIVVAGNILPNEAQKLFDQSFSNRRKLNPTNRKKIEIEKYTERRQIEKKSDIQQIQLILASMTAASDTKDSLTLELFASMIDGGSSFPLYQELREKRGLCYHTGTISDRYAEAGFWGIYIGTDPLKYEEAITVAMDVVQNNKNNESLRKRAIDLILGRLSLSFENPGRIIENAAHDILHGEEPKSYKEIMKEIESISIKDIEKAVDTYLKPEDIRQVILAPKDLKI